MTGRTVHAFRFAALLSATTLTAACSQDSGPDGDDGSSQDAPSSSPTSDGAPRETSTSPGDAGRSDAPADAALEAAADTGADAPSDTKSDATVTSMDGAAPVSADGGDAQPAGPDGSLPGCGTWLSASPTHAGNRGTVQLAAARRDAGFGAVLDWNVSGGSGTGEFTNVTATAATFTCFTPGPVVVTATDPAGAPCVDAGYDQASVVIQCDGFIGQWASVSVGPLGACGVTVDGAAWCWSDATLNFELGNDTTSPSTFPAAVSGLTSGAASVSVGDELACAITTSGIVECWGGGFPAPSVIGGSTPAPLAGLPGDVTAISSAGQSACALTASQGVLCWGDDGDGQLGDGTTNSSAIPVAVRGLTGTTAAVSMGGAVACALSTTGVVQCWGDDSSGELGTGAPAATFSASPVTLAGLPASVTAVAAGNAFVCAMTSGGAVYCWGANERAELGNTSGTSSPVPAQVAGLPADVRSIAAGQDFACALTGSGAVWCWGDDFSGELGDDAAASLSSTLASAVPVPVIGLTSGVASISLGGQSACAITSGGELLCWGSDSVGQLGNPTTSFCASGAAANACLPVPVPIESAAPLANGSGAASGWCSQQQATHTLCEDFDQGFPGQFTVQPSAGSTVGEDDVDDQSSPRSMVATTSPISPLNVESTAWATFVSPTAGASFQLQADFKVGSDCFASVTRPVTIARVDYLDVGYSVAYSVTPALSGAGFVMQAGEAESTTQTPGPFGVLGGDSFIPADQWARLTLSAELGAGVSEGGSSVTLLTPNAPSDGSGGGIFGPSQVPASAPVLRIGADAAAHGCTVHIDNILFDVVGAAP